MRRWARRCSGRDASPTLCRSSSTRPRRSASRLSACWRRCTSRASKASFPPTMRGSWAISRARPPRASARRSARRIVIARFVAAGVIGLIAAVAAVGALVAARSPVTAFEWSVRPREVARVSPALVLITRDGASDARFSADTWDRAVLARVVTALARAGAAAIGIDVPLGLPGAPGRGGPTGDALLSQATARAGHGVFAIVPGEPVPALAQHARSVGHTLAPPDPDGVVRRIPVRAGVVDRSVPAWGLALVAAAREAALDAIPVDRDGRALMTFAPLLPTLTFSDVWTAIDQGQRDRLQGLVDGKIVLLLLDPGSWSGALRLGCSPRARSRPRSPTPR